MEVSTKSLLCHAVFFLRGVDEGQRCFTKSGIHIGRWHQDARVANRPSATLGAGNGLTQPLVLFHRSGDYFEVTVGRCANEGLKIDQNRRGEGYWF